MCFSDVNECEFVHPVCLHNGTCTNTNGSFQCNCTDTGYTKSICQAGQCS